MRRIYLPQYSASPITRPDGKPWAMATNIYNHVEDVPGV
jgi:hypothetical protein